MPASLERFAEQFRLKVSPDECGDSIIAGRRGRHLYFDHSELCAMFVDSPPVKAHRLKALVGPAGRVWMGDIGRKAGRRVQDVEIHGIQPEHYQAAIRLVVAHVKRTATPAQRAVLAKGRTLSPLFQAQGKTAPPEPGNSQEPEAGPE